ncbi:MAG: hypothetical protein QM594_00605 [Niabella sp.]
MKIQAFIVLAFILLPGIKGSAQEYPETDRVFDRSNYAHYAITADSIIELYYGKDMLPYITKDSTHSYYRTLKAPGGGIMCSFRDTLRFEPEMFSFRYYFRHPSFKGDSLKINFYIHQNGTLMAGFIPTGLFDMRGILAFSAISSQKALEIAKRSKIKKPLKNYTIELGWAEVTVSDEEYKVYQQSKDLRDFVKGRIVWMVKSTFKIPKEWDETPNAETFLIDVLTGKVIQVWQDTVDWG